jgi:hypothetical protein
VRFNVGRRSVTVNESSGKAAFYLGREVSLSINCKILDLKMKKKHLFVHSPLEDARGRCYKTFLR